MRYPDYSNSRIEELVSLEGRTAVITGGAAGLGQAIARRLAEAGARIVLGDLEESSAQAAIDALAPVAGGSHVAAPLDVMDHGSVAALADLAIDKTGRIDVWVNNAGIYPGGGVLEITDAAWNAVQEINLRGTFFGAREAAVRMGSGRGVIVNLASTAGFDCTNGLNPAHYVASKHAVVGLTKSLAVELGPKGIRAVGVAPTMTETKGVAEMRGRHQDVNTALNAYSQALPLGRSGVPDDIARVVLFLVSDLAAFVTGTVVPVDGGDLAR